MPELASPEASNKYKAVITPVGVDQWTVTIYECAEEPFRISEQQFDQYTDEMITLKAKAMLKDLVNKREAIKQRQEIVITEDDLTL